DLNMSRAAQVLCTSQAAVSKQILLLEDELGVQLFLRKGKRFICVTSAGKDVLAISKRMIKEVENIRAATMDHKDQSVGKLIIAATTTQICYKLPAVIRQFALLYPRVQIVLHEGTPEECVERVLKGDADLCISTEVIQRYPEMALLPCYEWGQCIVTLPGHPLTTCTPLSLRDIARYPIVTYEFNIKPHSKVYKAFTAAHLCPEIALTATDSRIIKSYVQLGFGVGLVGATAIDPDEDSHLAIVDAGHLFERSTTAIGLFRNSRPRAFVFQFIALYSPKLTRDIIETALHSGGDSASDAKPPRHDIADTAEIAGSSVTLADMDVDIDLQSEFHPLTDCAGQLHHLIPLTARSIAPSVAPRQAETVNAKPVP
ncbi:MAG: LysR family transcriptional regulator, partial [Candidimonas sp.]